MWEYIDFSHVCVNALVCPYTCKCILVCLCTCEHIYIFVQVSSFACLKLTFEVFFSVLCCFYWSSLYEFFILRFQLSSLNLFIVFSKIYLELSNQICSATFKIVEQYFKEDFVDISSRRKNFIYVSWLGCIFTHIYLQEYVPSFCRFSAVSHRMIGKSYNFRHGRVL